MSSSRFPVPMQSNPRTAVIEAPVAFAHRTAPVAFIGGLSALHRPAPDAGFRFEGRMTRPSRFPVEAALAMNDPGGARVGHHVDMHC